MGSAKRRSMTPEEEVREANYANESLIHEDQKHHSYTASACKDEQCTYCAKDTVTEENLCSYIE